MGAAEPQAALSRAALDEFLAVVYDAYTEVEEEPGVHPSIQFLW